MMEEIKEEFREVRERYKSLKRLFRENSKNADKECKIILYRKIGILKAYIKILLEEGRYYRVKNEQASKQ
jgi:hypothetical protein